MRIRRYITYVVVFNTFQGTRRTYVSLVYTHPRGLACSARCGKKASPCLGNELMVMSVTLDKTGAV
jgi:hypothetical protein